MPAKVAVKPEPAKAPKPTWVYLADDEGDEAQFNCHVFKIDSGSTEIVSPWKEHKAETIAAHIAEKLHKWGVCVVHGPVDNGKASLESDQQAVDAAKLRYLRNTHEWARNLILDSYLKNRHLTDAGLSVVESEETRQARAWLKSREKDLRTAGLVE